MPIGYSGQFFLLPQVKFLSSVNSSTTCSSSYPLYKCIRLVIVFVNLLFIPPKMASGGFSEFIAPRSQTTPTNI